jgi:chitinase
VASPFKEIIMTREFLYRGLSLLGVVGALSGCAIEAPESSEEISRMEGDVIVSSITEGDYVIRSAMTQKCIDISSSSTADGAKVQEWDCNGTNAQKFHISPTSDGYWRIINVNSNKGLDIKEVSTAPNALVHQWTYSGGNNQQFKFVARGNNQFSIHARHTDMAIDLYWGSADNGTILVQYPYTSGANQLWTFDNVGAGGGGGGGGSGFGAILSRSMFDTMFPNRNPFYTYDALVAAASTFQGLATTGDTDTRKREVAAFLANVSHETGGLVYVEEINKAVYSTPRGARRAAVAPRASGTTGAAPCSCPGTATTAPPGTRSGCRCRATRTCSRRTRTPRGARASGSG